MRIAFDGTALRPRRTGVGYYTEHLLRHLAQTADGDEFVIVSNRPVETDAPLPDRVRRKYGLRDRIVLYVGTIEPRKNLPTLIEAFARGRRRGELDHQLVCVGPYGWLSRDLDERIRRAGVADAISFTGYVPFED